MASSLKGVDSPNRLEVRLLRGKSGRSARR
jgi:hypothetical protein